MHRLFGAIVLAMTLLGAPMTASAGAAQSVAGDFVVTGFTLVATPEQRGETCFLEAEAPFRLSGAVSGEIPLHFEIIQSAPCSETGPQSFQATGVFAGTVDGVAGSFTVSFQGHIDAESHARGELAVLHGSGGLESLHGHLTLSGQAGVGGTYEGMLTFGDGEA